MKHLLSFILLFICSYSFAQDIEFTAVHDYDDIFKEAYDTYPNVPKGILEAIAYTQTHIKDVNRNHEHESCSGIPHYYGVMGLVQDGKGWFNNNLKTVSQISKYSVEDIRSSPRKNILAFAQSYQILMNRKNITNHSPSNHIEILNDLSELPNDGSKGNDFAFDTYLYSVFAYLNDAVFRNTYGIPDYQLDLKEIFGKNYDLLSSSQIKVENGIITSDENSYQGNAMRSSMACSDTSIPTVYAAADPSNYSSRAGTAISHVTIHTMQGSYSGSISWFQNPSANVSAHYNLRASDGQITQMVCEADKAWHVGNSNPYSVGIEHEGYVADPTWYTENMYQASASLTADICSRNNIPVIRTYDKNGDTAVNPLGDGCFKVKGHQHFANQSHVDPGQYWDWNRYYDLLNPVASATQHTYTTCTGNFQDPGGSGSSGNDEREFYLIQPTNATAVTLSFNSFNLETNYDYLYVYDGDSYQDSLITILNGSSIPAPITGTSGSLFLEFRSDCATLSTGWDASWTCSSSNACEVPQGLSQTNNNSNEVTFLWNAVDGAADYTFRIKRNIETNWEYYTTSNNSFVLGGLATDGYYLWGVNTNCASSSSTFNGTSFINTGSLTTSQVSNSCNGQFTDSGSTLANYHNNEDWTYTIAPPGATSISLSFSSFDIESNYDYMYIYDGLSTDSPLLGTYTGTNSPETITSTGEALTIRFTSDNWTTNPGWEATWTCISDDNIPPVTEIGTIPNWVTEDFNLGFLDADNIQVTRQFYQTSSLDNTEWSANSNNGFLTDEFNSLSAAWTSYTGTWNTASGSLFQSDESSSNTILSANLNQTGTDEYLYHWNSNIGGTGTNKRAGLHFFCDDASASNRGNSYFVYYRIDSDLLQIYEVSDNVFSLVSDIPMVFNANQNYDFKVLYNPITGTIDVFVDDELAGSWTDATPLTSGGYVSFRSGNCTYTIDDFNVYKSRNTNETITIGADVTDDIRTQSENAAVAAKVKSIVFDGSDLVSLIAEADFKVDYTAPSSVSNLLGSIVDETTIDGSWNASTDVHSGINFYEYSIGTTAGGTELSPWNYNGINTSFIESGLSLVDGQTYYVNVRAVNGAGLSSEIASSTGFIYEAHSPCNYALYATDNFEAGYGNWNNGGSNCRRHLNDANYANSGNYCVRLRSKGFYAKVTSDVFDLTNYEEMRIDFSYYARSMDNSNEDFWLQISYNGGQSFTTIEEWNKGDEFQNNKRKYDSVVIPGPFTSTTRFRFRCDASSIYDWVYLDNIKIYGCSNASAREINPEINLEMAQENTMKSADEDIHLSDVKVYPNPVQNLLQLEYEAKGVSDVQLTILDVSGRIIRQEELSAVSGFQIKEMDVSELDNGYYLIYISSGNERKFAKFLKM